MGKNKGSEPKKRKAKKRAWITAGVILVLFIIFMVVGSNLYQQKKNDETPKEEPIVDVIQFSKISTDQLVSIMGEPESVEEWDNNGIPTTTYVYKDGSYEFLAVDKTIVEMNMYASPDTTMEYTSVSEMCHMFEIPAYDKILMTENNGYSMRFGNVGYGIDEIWIPEFDPDTKEIKIIKFAFDATKV